MELPAFIYWFPVGLVVAFVVVVSAAMIRVFLQARDTSTQRVLQSTHKTEAVVSSKGEKRRADRVPCNWMLELLPGADLITSASARLLNLSSTGACFASKVALTPGAYVSGRINTVKDGPVRFSALVIWRKVMQGMTLHGIQFDR